MKGNDLIFVSVGVLLGAGALVFLALRKQRLDKISAIKSNKILFIGDSITAGDHSYAAQYKKLHPEKSVTIISQVGAKTDWMKTKLQEELAKSKYDAVFIAGGTNDAASYGYPTGANKAKDNLSAMFSMIKNSGASALALIPPSASFHPSNNPAIEQNVKIISDFIKNSSMLHGYVDWGAITKSANQFVDGIHPIASLHNYVEQMIEDLV